MKEESDRNYEPLYNLLKTHGLTDLVNCELDEIINCVKSIERPTPVVQAKTAEEIQKLDRCYNLLPCPFCGGKEGEAVVMGYKYPHYRASCMDCGYFISDDRTDKVVYHWNRRQFTPSKSNWIPNLSEMDGQLVDKEVEITRLEESLKTIYSLAKPGSAIYDICDKTLNQKK